MAVRLINQRPIRYVHYLKLMQAHQMEQDRAQTSGLGARVILSIGVVFILRGVGVKDIGASKLSCSIFSNAALSKCSLTITKVKLIWV